MSKLKMAPWWIVFMGLSLSAGMISFFSATAGNVRQGHQTSQKAGDAIIPGSHASQAADGLPAGAASHAEGNIPQDFVKLLPAVYSPGIEPNQLITPTTGSGIAAAIGLPNPGTVTDITIDMPVLSTDGEGADSYLFYAPQGWEILGISDAPPANNPGCPSAVTQAFANPGGRGIAYWGFDHVNLDVTQFPPVLPPRSGCGPYASNTILNFVVTFRVDPAAATCPGAPRWAGIQNDSPGFTDLPVLPDSMPTYLRGDGSTSITSTIKINWTAPCPAPAITLDKTVTTDSAVCAVGGGDPTIDVLPGVTVHNCFILLNNSTLVTVSVQTITDSILGDVVTGWQNPIPALNGDYTTTPHLVTGEPGTCINNTATWSATTDIGYGQSPVDDLAAPFTSTRYTLADIDSASVCIIDTNLWVNLPVILTNFASP